MPQLTSSSGRFLRHREEDEVRAQASHLGDGEAVAEMGVRRRLARWVGLEGELGGGLEDAGSADSVDVADAAAQGTADFAEVGAEGGVRQAEGGGVGKVEGVESEFDGRFVDDGEALEEGEVVREVAGTAEGVATGAAGRRVCAAEAVGGVAGVRVVDLAAVAGEAEVAGRRVVEGDRGVGGRSGTCAAPRTENANVAEAVYAVQRTVEDVLSRRTRALLLDARAAQRAAPMVEKAMAKELGRGQDWIDAQRWRSTSLRSGFTWWRNRFGLPRKQRLSGCSRKKARGVCMMSRV
jgi:hypothetical protein